MINAKQQFDILSQDCIDRYAKQLNKDFKDLDIYESIKAIADEDEEVAIFTISDSIPNIALSTKQLSIRERMNTAEIGVDMVVNTWAGQVGQPSNDEGLSNPHAYNYVRNLYHAVHSARHLLNELPALRSLLISIHEYQAQIEQFRSELQSLEEELSETARCELTALKDRVLHYHFLGNILMADTARKELKDYMDANPEMISSAKKQKEIHQKQMEAEGARKMLVEHFLSKTSHASSMLFAIMGNSFFHIEPHDSYMTNKSSDRNRLISEISSQLLQLCGGVPKEIGNPDTECTQGLIDRYKYFNPNFYTEGRTSLIKLQVMSVGRVVLDQLHNLPDEIFELLKESSSFPQLLTNLHTKAELDRKLIAIDRKHTAIARTNDAFLKSLIAVAHIDSIKNPRSILDSEAYDNFCVLIGLNARANFDTGHEATRFVYQALTVFDACVRKLCAIAAANSEDCERYNIEAQDFYACDVNQILSGFEACEPQRLIQAIYDLRENEGKMREFVLKMEKDILAECAKKLHGVEMEQTLIEEKTEEPMLVN